MTRKLVRYSSAACLAFLVLASETDVALAQDTPEMREVLSRLEHLEETNQALAEEILALRKELAALRAPGVAAQAAVSAPTSTDGQPPPVKRVSGRSARSATKPHRRAGSNQSGSFAKISHPHHGHGACSMPTPMAVSTISPTTPPSPRFPTATPPAAERLRQSTLGLLFDGPYTFAGGKVSGSLYMDFFGGSTSSLNHLVRLRTAAINLDWTNTTLTVGQDKPIISPRDPDSYAQVGVSPLTGAGNLWLWQPQIRLEQRYSFGSRHRPASAGGRFSNQPSEHRQ